MENKSEIKRVSVEAYDKVMREEGYGVKTVEWHDIDITIKKSLSLKDTLTFVDSVVKSCFNEETNAYLPEIKVFAIKCCILEMYANFTLPSNIEHKYDLVYNTDAVDTVIKYINTRQLDEILDAINDKVDNIAQANIESINKQMNELFSVLNNLQEQMESIFSGVGNGEISKLVGAITGDKFDESKLVQAYMNNKNMSTAENVGED